MTSLTSRKSRLCFMSEATVYGQGRSRRIVVEVDRDGYAASLRLEGTRQRFPLSFASMYTLAVQKEVSRIKAEKKAGKKK